MLRPYLRIKPACLRSPVTTLGWSQYRIRSSSDERGLGGVGTAHGQAASLQRIRAFGNGDLGYSGFEVLGSCGLCYALCKIGVRRTSCAILFRKCAGASTIRFRETSCSYLGMSIGDFHKFGSWESAYGLVWLFRRHRRC